MTCILSRKQTSLSFKFQFKTLVNVTCYYSLESNPRVGILVLDLLILTSHLVLIDINIEYFFYIRGHIDVNF